MSLQDEMLEQNGLYQATMQENEELKERVAALEQLVSDAQPLMEKHYSEIKSAYGLLHAVRYPDQAKIEAWLQRTKAVLEEGKYDDHRTTGV